MNRHKEPVPADQTQSSKQGSTMERQKQAIIDRLRTKWAKLKSREYPQPLSDMLRQHRDVYSRFLGAIGEGVQPKSGPFTVHGRNTSVVPQRRRLRSRFENWKTLASADQGRKAIREALDNWVRQTTSFPIVADVTGTSRPKKNIKPPLQRTIPSRGGNKRRHQSQRSARVRSGDVHYRKRHMSLA